MENQYFEKKHSQKGEKKTTGSVLGKCESQNDQSCAARCLELFSFSQNPVFTVSSRWFFEKVKEIIKAYDKANLIQKPHFH